MIKEQNKIYERETKRNQISHRLIQLGRFRDDEQEQKFHQQRRNSRNLARKARSELSKLLEESKRLNSLLSCSKKLSQGVVATGSYIPFVAYELSSFTGNDKLIRLKFEGASFSYLQDLIARNPPRDGEPPRAHMDRLHTHAWVIAKNLEAIPLDPGFKPRVAGFHDAFAQATEEVEIEKHLDSVGQDVVELSNFKWVELANACFVEYGPETLRQMLIDNRQKKKTTSSSLDLEKK